VWLACWAAPAAALAQQPGDPEPPENPTEAEAQRRYHNGRQLYEEGRYSEAVVELEAALALDPDEPVLLYNLALVQEKLGHYDEAIGALRRMLQGEIPDDERARAESAIRRLEGARTYSAPPRPEVIRVPVPVEVERPPPQGSFGRADTVFFVAVGATAAALVTTAIAGALALSAETDVDRFVLGETGDLDDRQAVVDRADSLALVADVALVVTAVAAVSGTLLYALRRGDPDEPPAPGLTWQGTGLRGRF